MLARKNNGHAARRSQAPFHDQQANTNPRDREVIFIAGIVWGVFWFLMGLQGAFVLRRNDGVASLLALICGVLLVLPICDRCKMEAADFRGFIAAQFLDLC